MMKTEQQIIQRIKIYLADILELEPNSIDENYEFVRFGLHSYATIALVGDLEEWLGIELSPALFFEFPTITQVAHHLVETIRTENSLENAVEGA